MDAMQLKQLQEKEKMIEELIRKNKNLSKAYEILEQQKLIIKEVIEEDLKKEICVKKQIIQTYSTPEGVVIIVR